VQRVRQIRALLAAGLPTRLIQRLLPCTDPEGNLDACPGVLDTLRGQLSRLDQQAAGLAASQELLRDAINRLTLSTDQ
jgi:DNA-binding transcriptional MerR regulator